LFASWITLNREVYKGATAGSYKTGLVVGLFICEKGKEVSFMRTRNISLLMLFLLCFLGAAVVAAADPIGVSVSSGLTSTVSGAVTESFSSGLPSGFTDTCTAGSTDCGVFPPANVDDIITNPTGNTSNFITTGVSTAGESIGINLGTVQTALHISTPINYFGLYWGSVDPYNTIDLYDGTTLVDSYTGAELLALDSSITPDVGSAFVNFAFNGNTITSITLSSTFENFETVNEAFAETPEPATLALMGIGLLGLGFLARSRARQSHWLNRSVSFLFSERLILEEIALPGITMRRHPSGVASFFSLRQIGRARRGDLPKLS
jgi:hypothetical protein